MVKYNSTSALHAHTIKFIDYGVSQSKKKCQTRFDPDRCTVFIW